jgi:hypothetical protein
MDLHTRLLLYALLGRREDELPTVLRVQGHPAAGQDGRIVPHISKDAEEPLLLVDDVWRPGTFAAGDVWIGEDQSYGAVAGDGVFVGDAVVEDRLS